MLDGIPLGRVLDLRLDLPNENGLPCISPTGPVARTTTLDSNSSFRVQGATAENSTPRVRRLSLAYRLTGPAVRPLPFPR